jgi:hypothetical protein
MVGLSGQTEEKQPTKQDIDDACAAAYSRAKAQMTDTLCRNRAWRQEFERRLCKRGGKAFDLYELAFITARDAGDALNRKHRPQAIIDNDLLFDALTQLHARACLTAGEILTLLKSAYPTATWGRWRTLHEITVIAMFVKEHGRETARRYLLHEAVETAKAANQFQEYHARIGRQALEQQDLDAINQRRTAIVDHFGAEYKEEYGWAAGVLGNSRPNLFDLEEAVAVEHLRPFFRFASHGIHGGSRGTSLNTKELRSQAILVAGPSNADLAEPAHAALLSLQECTLALLDMRGDLLTIETVATMKTLVALVEEAGSTFAEIEDALNQEEEEIAQQS